MKPMVYYRYIPGMHYNYDDVVILHPGGFITELAYRCTCEHDGGYIMDPVYWERIRLVTMR